MRYVLPFSILASPVLAHDGGHLHPHGSETWILLSFLALAGAVILAVRK
ncbi:hypothetical protein C8N32_10414 [Rhodovulum imhoffii]|uniref:Peptidase M23 n=1 Tax=Rhodovulum imhoffii TaxID=365340 RepID=A0A2T5BTV2_9RHOB|nr:peptidase M23 [Rhodovulum imhoffii]PTN02903.1 hypothetical protein C8N32_10414 [Rhodovulum imhoffii]